MINLSIKNQLLLLTVSIMLIMLAVISIGLFLYSTFEHARQNQAAADRVVKLVQQARIAEKAYRQYYLKDYRHVVTQKTSDAKQLLQKIKDDYQAKGQDQIMDFIASYEDTFAEMIRSHERNLMLSNEIEGIMTNVQATSKKFMDTITERQFNARTLHNRELDQMESGLMSPLQDANQLSFFLQLNHQRFLSTNDSQHLTEIYRFFSEYGPGLFGALKQGAAYLGNRFYQRSVKTIETNLNSAVVLLEKSRELLSKEESQVSLLDQIGSGLETQTDRMLQLATNSSRKAKTTAFTVAAVIFVLGVVLIVYISFTLTRSITRPLENMVRAANAISYGDLSVKIPHTRQDEFSKLASAFNNMTDKLNNLLGMLELEISERKSAETELKKLSRRMILNQEMERTAVARELHDELGQVLTALKIDAVWIKQHAPFKDKRSLQRIDNMCDFIEKSFDDVKSLSLRLRPKVLDDMGLAVALRWLGSDFETRTGVSCAVLTQDVKVKNDILATNLYRVAQECLTNVARHAQADRVEMRLEVTKDGALMLVVQDSGQGFDTSRIKGQEALGIAGMMERAELIGALFEIASQPGGGCKVSLKISNNSWDRDKS